MERFASCYFCGADAQLTEHQLLPEGLGPDQQATAVLCPTCRRKLEGVVELVLEAASTAPAADESETTDTPVPEEADEPETPVGPADEPPVAGEEPPDEPADEPAPAEEPKPAEADTDDAEVIDGPADDEPDKPDPLDGVSVMDYNRVMRLLQNREFPINRGEFEVVAREAYDLRAQTVGAVLDAVIQRGLLVEENGELVRPGQQTTDGDGE